MEFCSQRFIFLEYLFLMASVLLFPQSVSAKPSALVQMTTSGYYSGLSVTTSTNQTASLASDISYRVMPEFGIGLGGSFYVLASAIIDTANYIAPTNIALSNLSKNTIGYNFGLGSLGGRYEFFALLGYWREAFLRSTGISGLELSTASVPKVFGEMTFYPLNGPNIYFGLSGHGGYLTTTNVNTEVKLQQGYQFGGGIKIGFGLSSSMILWIFTEYDQKRFKLNTANQKTAEIAIGARLSTFPSKTK